MPPAYVVAQIDVKDAAAFERYREQAPATIAKYGGEYLVRGGRWEKLEGKEPLPRIVMLKFPSMEKALEWYRSPDYAGPLKLRLSASDSNSFLVEGMG